MKPSFSIIFALLAFASFGQSGKWLEKPYEVEGKWEIVETSGGTHYLLFDEGFDTKKASDLKPELCNKINADNALKGSIKISELKSYKGKQVI